MGDLLYKELTYQLIGVLFDVHNELGGGFLEVVYADAVEYELKERNIPYEREKKYQVHYKDTVLPHHFYADFVVFDKIILELKSATHLHDTHVAQCLNYLKISKLKLALLVNFEGEIDTSQDHPVINFHLYFAPHAKINSRNIEAPVPSRLDKKRHPCISGFLN